MRYNDIKNKGIGIYLVSIFLFIINIWYLNFLDKDFLATMIKDVQTPDKIAILASSIIAIGFLYYIGFLTARREKQIFTKQPLQYTILFHGGLLSLGIYLPLLLYFYGQGIFGLILINIILVGLYGYISEIHTHRKVKATLIMTDAKETSNGKPNEDLTLVDTRDGDYVFSDKNGNYIVIPIGQIKEIRLYHDNK